MMALKLAHWTPYETEQILIAMNSLVSIVKTDRSGNVSKANDKFCEISGCDKTVLIGNSLPLLHSTHHPPEFFAKLWSQILAGKIWRGQIRNSSPAGRPYWLDVSIFPLGNAHASNFLFICHDITEQKDNESQLIETQAKLEILLQAGGIGIRVEAYADTKPLPAEEVKGLSPEETLARHRRVVVRLY